MGTFGELAAFGQMEIKRKEIVFDDYYFFKKLLQAPRSEGFANAFSA